MSSSAQPTHVDIFLIFWRYFALILLKGTPQFSAYRLSRGSLTCFLSAWPVFKLNIIPSHQTNSFSPHSSALSLIHRVRHFQHSQNFPLFSWPFVFLSYLSLKTPILYRYLSFVSLAPTHPSGLCSKITSSGLTLTPQVSLSLCFMLSQWPMLFLHRTCQSF